MKVVVDTSLLAALRNIKVEEIHQSSVKSVACIDSCFKISNSKLIKVTCQTHDSVKSKMTGRLKRADNSLL